MSDVRPTAFTMSLKNIIDSNLSKAKSELDAVKFLNKIEDGINHYKAMFSKISNPLDRAYNLHRFINETIEEKFDEKAKSEIKCKAGCAFCCHNPVVVNEEEAMLAIEYAKDLKIDIDWDRVRRQAKFEGDEHAYFLQPKSESRCVFLGEGNLCNVYEHRPAACRKYFAITEPALCDSRTGPQEVGVIADTQVELAASGFMDMDHSKVGMMAPMLLQAKSNMAAFCNYCRKETETKEWDCVKCGLSKGNP